MTKFLGCMTDAATTGQPVEPSTVTVGASPFTFTAPSRGELNISGGTVSAVALVRAVSHSLGGIAGNFGMSPGDKLTITYSVAPTLTFIPL